MSTITPISGMPASELHGAMIGRSVTFSKVYADGFIDTQLIRESQNDIELPNFADIPDSKKHGKLLSTSIHGLIVFADGYSEGHTSYQYDGPIPLCPCPPGCNPAIDPLCTG